MASWLRRISCLPTGKLSSIVQIASVGFRVEVAYKIEVVIKYKLQGLFIFQKNVINFTKSSNTKVLAFGARNYLLSQ